MNFIRIFLFAFVFTFTDIVAQTNSGKQEPVKVTFYYNVTWQLTVPEKSVYRREAFFDLTDMVFDGVYSDYNKENKLIADGIYNHGIKTGIHTEYADAAVKTKIEYSGEDFTIWEWNDGKTDGIKNGTGKFSTYCFYFVSFDGQIVPREGMVQGEFRNGRKNGRWFYFDLKENKTDEERYSNGKLTRHVYYSQDDSVALYEKKTIYLSLNSLNTEALAFDKSIFTYLNQYFEKYVTYPAKFQRNVSYPKGWKHLLKIMSQSVAVPERNLEVLGMKMDEHGQVEKPLVARSINSIYDDLSEELFEVHRTRLLPAMKNGKPVASVVFLPIASGEEWMKMLHEMPVEWFLDSSNFY